MACGDTLASCVCANGQDGHEDPHVCECAGSWERTPDGLRIWNFPDSHNGLARLMGWKPGDLVTDPDKEEG